MKKAVVSVIAVLLAVTMLAGCSMTPAQLLGKAKTLASGAIDKIKSADIPSPVISADTEKAHYSWAQAYLEIIDICKSRNGVFSETINENTEVTSREGLFICSLFDWNEDGTPELMVGFSPKGAKSLNFEKLSVYTYSEGKAAALLSEIPGGRDDGEEANTVKLLKNEDGKYYIEVAHSYDDGAKNDYCVYSFDGAKVDCTKFYYGTVDSDEATGEEVTEEPTTAPEETTAEAAEEENEDASQAENEEETEETETEAETETTVPSHHTSDEYSYFCIDGRRCSRTEFYEKRNEIDFTNAQIINCEENVDYSQLVEFLSGKLGDYIDPVSKAEYLNSTQG